MIVPTWPGHFRRRYGDKWPDYYLAWDCETSGFSFEKDVILEIGHVLVEKGKVVDRGCYAIDWRDHGVVPTAWLRGKLEYTAGEMRKQGKTFHCTWDYLCEKGKKPDKVFPFYMRFFADLIANNCAFVGHNLAFDEHMFAANAVGFDYAKEFVLPDDRFWDTHSIEKANQLVGDPRVMPKPGESLRSYFERVHRVRATGVKSSLDGHCLAKYKLSEKGVDPATCHRADADAFMVHLLMEEFRAQATRNGQPTFAPATGPSPASAGAFEPQEIPWDRVVRKDAPRPVSGPHPVRHRGQRNN